MIALFTFLGEIGITMINLGISMGLTFGARILLRPITGRLLRPKHQVWLWFVGWYAGYLVNFYNLLGQWVPIPFSFRTLVVPRVEGRGMSGLPMYISTGGQQAPSLMLPGGAEFFLPSDLFDRLLPVIGVVWIGVFVAALVWGSVQERRLRRLGQQGERMDRETMAKYGITEENVAVRLCEGLPASFVRFGHDTGWGDKVRFVICLQKELPQEQMRLVLLHEMKHIELHHAWYKSVIVVGLTAFYWWNPIMWLAYRLTCRDMELACDEAVLEELEPAQRRDYARTLVDLGSGRHLWGNMTSFGECDAALRVRRAAGWSPENRAAWIVSVTLCFVLVVFFYCGGPRYDNRDEREPIPEPTWNEYLSQESWKGWVADSVGVADQVWSGKGNQLLVLDKRGEWYAITFSNWVDGCYGRIRVSQIEAPSLEGYTQIA